MRGKGQTENQLWNNEEHIPLKIDAIQLVFFTSHRASESGFEE